VRLREYPLIVRGSPDTAESDGAVSSPLRDTRMDVECLIRTDWTGRVREIDPASAAILSMSRRALVGRDLLLFFPGNRQALACELGILWATGHSREMTVKIKPRECRSRNALMRMRRSNDDLVEWRVVILE
jgi:hypothetical protein